MEEYITDKLRDVANGYNAHVNIFEEAAEEIEQRDHMLRLMQDFLVQSGMRADFEATLDYEERIWYRKFFDIEDDFFDDDADFLYDGIEYEEEEEF